MPLSETQGEQPIAIRKLALRLTGPYMKSQLIPIVLVTMVSAICAAFLSAIEANLLRPNPLLEHIAEALILVSVMGATELVFHRR